MKWFKGLAANFYDSVIQNLFKDLIKVWTTPTTMWKNKIIYRQLIHSVAFLN